MCAIHGKGASPSPWACPRRESVSVGSRSTVGAGSQFPFRKDLTGRAFHHCTLAWPQGSTGAQSCVVDFRPPTAHYMMSQNGAEINCDGKSGGTGVQGRRIDSWGEDEGRRHTSWVTGNPWAGAPVWTNGEAKQRSMRSRARPRVQALGSTSTKSGSDADTSNKTKPRPHRPEPSWSRRSE